MSRPTWLDHLSFAYNRHPDRAVTRFHLWLTGLAAATVGGQRLLFAGTDTCLPDTLRMQLAALHAGPEYRFAQRCRLELVQETLVRDGLWATVYLMGAGLLLTAWRSNPWDDETGPARLPPRVFTLIAVVALLATAVANGMTGITLDHPYGDGHEFGWASAISTLAWIRWLLTGVLVAGLLAIVVAPLLPTAGALWQWRLDQSDPYAFTPLDISWTPDAGPRPDVAIGLSGGGIRSGALAQGALSDAHGLPGEADHSAGVSDRRVAGPQASTPTTRTGSRHIAALLLGSSLIGLGVSLFVRAGLGVPPYDVLLTALRDRLGLSLGQAGWLFTGLLFVVATMLGQRPRPSALAYILANGIAVDTFIHLIRSPDQMAVRFGFVVLGTLAIAAAISLILHVGLTGGAFELLMWAGERRGLNRFHVRTALEMSVIVAGVALGGDIGPATAVYVVAMSPTIRSLQMALSDHRNGRHLRLLSEHAVAPGEGRKVAAE
jgi:uncharacterized membrane protein YczE